MSTIYTNIRHNVYSWFSGLYNIAPPMANELLEKHRCRVYACRQLKAGDAVQPKGCSARFVL